MIVKGEILTIDYAGNTCTVRMPVFESAAGGDKCIGPATISNTPGSYNGYKEGDVVLVAFENGQIQNPVVIGKLYLGAATESKEARGSVNCTTLVSENTNTLPLSTKLINDTPNLITSQSAEAYKTVKDIINKKQDKLTAGTNITITYDAQNNTVISASGDLGSVAWGSITGTLSNQTDLQTALNAKQNKLTAGENITIINDVISASSGRDPFPAEFVTNGTTAEFGQSVINYSGFAVGKVWLGELRCTDLPNGLVNIECTVEALTETPKKIAVIRMSSSNQSPFCWEYNTDSYNQEMYWDWKLVPAIQSREIPTTAGKYPVAATVRSSGEVVFSCQPADTAAAILNVVYPVGSVYITVGTTCPFTFGTWVQLATGKTLWNVDATQVTPGTDIAEGLPNITGTFTQSPKDGQTTTTGMEGCAVYNLSGAFEGQIATDPTAITDIDESYSRKQGSTYANIVGFNASKSNNIYGNTTNVQPAAVATTMWKRTA